jgi:FKBP-type peptidyl-prolyl cis-trans isomerase
VAKSGMNVTVQYGVAVRRRFRFSRQAGRTPFTLQIGRGQVIPGWDRGSRHEGRRQRKLIIPERWRTAHRAK